MGGLVEQARAVAAGQRSSEELVEAALRAAEALQPALNAFTMLFADPALAQARAADAALRSGTPPGLLHGVPVAVKDLFDVAGRVTSGCCRAYADRPPASADAPAVAALRRAGAVVIGKTNMHELAFGATNTVSSYGPANNPWDPERMPGGSSGGSAAAVAARIVPLALGSDTGGSVRIPSSFCGIGGLKTTHGLIPLDGVLPMSPSLDTVGPIAADAEDLALALAVLTGGDLAAVPGSPVAGLRLGVPTEFFFEAVDDEVAAAVSAAVEALAGSGARVRDIPSPWAREAHEAWTPVALAEFARCHRTLLEREDAVHPSIHALMRAGAGISDAEYEAARERMDHARAAFARSFDDLDVLVAPAIPVAAPRHRDETVRAGGTELPVHLGAPSTLTRAISTPGAPALALPCGTTASGLPVGMQLVGPRGSEAFLLNVGRAYQAMTGWHTRVPPIHA